jgi:hypothetical protein
MKPVMLLDIDGVINAITKTADVRMAPWGVADRQRGS